MISQTAAQKKLIAALKKEIRRCRKTEEGYKETLSRLSLITDSLPVLICYVDAEGRYRFNNKEYERWHGHSCEEIYGRHVRDILGEEAYRGITGYMNTALSGKEISYDRWFKFSRLQDRFVRVTYIPDKGADGVVRGFITLVYDLTDRFRLEDSLRRLAKRIVRIEEEQRKKLAADLHDQLGTDLAALSLNLNIVKGLLSKAADRQIQSRINDSLAIVEEIADHVRGVMSELRPMVLDEYGLLAALKWYSSLVCQRTGMNVTVLGRKTLPRLPQEVESALFRIAQEALTNSIKHSRTAAARIILKKTGTKIHMSITDRGAGFDHTDSQASRKSQGMGLTLMKERTESIGGLFLIEASPGKGTAVHVEIEVCSA